MSQTDQQASDRISVVHDYFRRVDAGRPDLVDLMTDDVQIYFPKFGVGRGKAAVAELARGITTDISSIEHDFDRFNFITSGDFVVTEGFEGGKTPNGGIWPDPAASEGRFCNVFEFDGLLIKRVHIYADPDFTSADRDRLHWGTPVRADDRHA